MSIFFFKQKTAYEMRISDWSSDVCSSDLKISTYRQRAEKDVLAHPVLVERGISAMWQGDPGVGKAAPLTRDEAEALRDVMFEQAGDDPALGFARSWAQRRILARVNKRMDLRGTDPEPLGVFLARDIGSGACGGRWVR